MSERPYPESGGWVPASVYQQMVAERNEWREQAGFARRLVQVVPDNYPQILDQKTDEIASEGVDVMRADLDDLHQELDHAKIQIEFDQENSRHLQILVAERDKLIENLNRELDQIHKSTRPPQWTSKLIRSVIAKIVADHPREAPWKHSMDPVSEEFCSLIASALEDYGK